MIFLNFFENGFVEVRKVGIGLNCVFFFLENGRNVIIEFVEVRF